MNHFLSNTRARFFASGFAAASLVTFAGSIVVNVTNYIFTIVMGRLLGVEHFGEVTALLGLLVIVTVPAAALTLFMAREVAGRSAHRAHALYSSLYKYTCIVAAGVWLVFALCAPAVAGYLNIALVPVYVFSVLLPLSIIMGQQSGTLQGLHSFTSLSAQGVIQAVLKLVISVIFVILGYAVAGVMAGLALAILAAWGFGYGALARAFAHHSAAGASDAHAKENMSAWQVAHLVFTFFFTALLLALLSNIDVVLAKHYLTPVLAGQYAALSTIGKIIVYAFSIAGTVLLPMASSAHARSKKEAHRLAIFVIGGVALCATFGAVFFALFSHLIISILFGARYIAVAPYLGLFAVAMAAMAVTITFVNYFIATHDTTFLYYFTVGIVLEISLIVMHHATILAITTALTTGALILLALMVVNFVRSTRRQIHGIEMTLPPTV